MYLSVFLPDHVLAHYIAELFLCKSVTHISVPRITSEKIYKKKKAQEDCPDKHSHRRSLCMLLLPSK